MIDDIDYLLKNSVEQSVVLYVDSSMRNKLHYPHPNEYTITFEQPFKNVYGFEVMDGAIPSTMYNIDKYNNDVYFAVVKKSPSAIVPIDPKAYFKEASTSSTLVELFNNGDNKFIAIGTEANLGSYVGPLLQDPSYKVFFRKTFINVPIVKKHKQVASEYYFFAYGNSEYALQISVGNQQAIDILEAKEFSISQNTSGSYDIVYYEIHDINATIFNQISASGNYIITINCYHTSLDVGNYDVLTITNNLNDLFNPYTIDVEPASQPPKQLGKMNLTSRNFILLNGAKGTMIESIGFDSYPQFTTTGTNFEHWTIGNNVRIFGSLIDPTVTSSTSYKIESPGLINLLGERFCILRIKELEDHIDGSYSYMSFTPGIGMFKMAAAAGGITNLRFDYVALVRKPFHPIGKLSKLTLSFTTKDGNPYDFKSVNHQLMFMVRFLVPAQKARFEKSILNPNYDPNIMQYMSNNRTIQNREDSDEEQEFDDEQHYQTYKKELDRYDYSTSETDESHSDESSEEEAL